MGLGSASPQESDVDLFTDSVTAGVQRALDGVSQQQQTTAANIANSATPGYHAQTTTFEDSLSAAMAGGTDPSTAAITTTDAGGAADATGNTVQLDTEIENQQREGLQYQALAQAMTFKLGLWSKALDK
jgi:flagellar basal-body rod protein FlgB